MTKRGIGTVLMVLALFLVGPVTPARAATALPGGKANWVVAVGGLNLASANNYADWVRLGYYTFATDGTVVTNYWTWNLTEQPVRVDSVTADCSGDVPDCAVKT